MVTMEIIIEQTDCAWRERKRERVTKGVSGEEREEKVEAAVVYLLKYCEHRREFRLIQLTQGYSSTAEITSLHPHVILNTLDEMEKAKNGEIQSSWATFHFSISAEIKDWQCTQSRSRRSVAEKKNNSFFF